MYYEGFLPDVVEIQVRVTVSEIFLARMVQMVKILPETVSELGTIECLNSNLALC